MVAKNAPIPLKLAAELQNVSVCIQFEAKDRDFIQYILYRLLKIRQILRRFLLVLLNTCQALDPGPKNPPLRVRTVVRTRRLLVLAWPLG